MGICTRDNLKVGVYVAKAITFVYYTTWNCRRILEAP